MLRQRIQDDMKAALKTADKRRLGTIHLVLAAVRQREVDERIELNDTQVLEVIDKLVKQRRASAEQYTQAGREDLAAQESYEADVCREYLPTALVDQAIATVGAASVRDMGKVMGWLKPQAQGRVDMGAVGKLVRERLAG